MTMRNFGSLAVLLALVGLSFGLVGCGDNQATTTDDVWIADADNPEDLARLAKELEIPMEELGEIEVHRGSKKDELATIYWPQKNVTIEGLQSYRIDVSDEYDGQGKLEFRKGKKVLYSEPFDPENSVTVGAIPQSVLDELKKGSSVKWGIFLEGKNKRDSVSTSFKVVSGDSVSRRIKKLEGSKHFLRQSPQVREMLKTEVILNKRLYSEALVQYLGILNAWPESTSPYRGIVKVCRRLDLEDTDLYVLASENVRGRGNRARSPVNTGIRNNPNAGGIGNSVDVGNLPKSIETTAPPLQQRTSDGPKPFGKGGVTPHEQDFTKKTDPEETGEPGVKVNDLAEQAKLREKAGIRYNELNDAATRMETHADEFQSRIDEIKEAQDEYNHFKSKLQSFNNDIEGPGGLREQAETAGQDYSDAQTAFQQAQSDWVDAGSPDPSPLKDDMDAKQAAMIDAEQKAQAAQHELQTREQDREVAQREFDKAETRLGEAAAAAGIGFDPNAANPVEQGDIEMLEQQSEQMQQMAQDAREQAEAFKNQVMKDLATPEEYAALEEANRIAEEQAAVAEARSNYYDARQNGIDALNALNAAEANAAQAQQDIDDANQALADAEQAYADAGSPAAGPVKDAYDAAVAAHAATMPGLETALANAQSDVQNAQSEVLNSEEQFNAALSELEALGIDPNLPEEVHPEDDGD